MSVLIKGMEMPKNCYECPFAMEYYSTLYAGRRSRFKATYSCVITHTAITSTKRNRFCPLVKIPPHGRLVDADALPDRYAEVRDLAPTIIDAEYLPNSERTVQEEEQK